MLKYSGIVKCVQDPENLRMIRNDKTLDSDFTYEDG